MLKIKVDFTVTIETENDRGPNGLLTVVQANNQTLIKNRQQDLINIPTAQWENLKTAATTLMQDAHALKQNHPNLGNFSLNNRAEEIEVEFGADNVLFVQHNQLRFPENVWKELFQASSVIISLRETLNRVAQQ